ncbi:hypothetical protein V8G54_031542 [Vigna mungo]|uniref:Pentatricopeptide repeat-containing protein n=1 Tax=Vigna mungo TaxID=3915 RepID=A0AAQ3MJK9_VIGMU
MHSFTSTTKCLTRFLPESLHLHQCPQGLLLPPLSLQSTLNPRVSPQFGSLPHQLTAVTLVGSLCACSSLRALRLGKSVDPYGMRLIASANIVFDNTVPDLYAKNGSLTYAKSLFDKMSMRDVISWTTLLMGYAATRLLMC